MKKVLVIGCPGSGKSTFSRELSRKTGLPLHHLDQMYWNADRTRVEKSIFLERLQNALATDSWIIDGNYGATMELRLAACDTVFFLDLPTEVCLAGIRARQGKPRPDMPWVENVGENDEEFLDFIRSYNTESRPTVLQRLNDCSGKTVYTFHSHAEMDAFLQKDV